jgi:hypothetical protein
MHFAKIPETRNTELEARRDASDVEPTGELLSAPRPLPRFDVILAISQKSHPKTEKNLAPAFQGPPSNFSRSIDTVAFVNGDQIAPSSTLAN